MTKWICHMSPEEAAEYWNRQKTEVKAKRKEYQRRYYQKKKLEKLKQVEQTEAKE